MTVTKIELFKKNRYRIYLDGEFAFILYKGELKTFKIEEDTQLSEKFYKQITEEVLVRRARLRAMNLLMKHRFTIKGLRDKLSDGEYPEEIIDNAIEYVMSYGYVNDRDYAFDYITCHKESRSINRLKNDLLSKGVPKEIIVECLEEIEQSDDPIDEEEQIVKLLQKKHYDPENCSQEETAKLYNFLCRKGFSLSKIQHVMRTFT